MRATVITDASYKLKQGRHFGGWAAWVRVDGLNSPLRGYGAIKDERLQNSNDAELFAALNGIWLATNRGAREILLRTDCESVVAIVEGRVRKGRTIRRWNEIVVTDPFNKVSLSALHVKGHAAIKTRAGWVNHWCDRHAKIGRTAAERGLPCINLS